MYLRLIHGDALKVLPKIEDESIDLILTDPPYNISKNQHIMDVRTKREIRTHFGDWDTGVITWQDFIDEFVRVLKPTGVLVLFYERFKLGCIAEYLKDKYDFTLRHLGAWIKTNPVPQFRKVKWQNSMEFFLVATKNSGTGHHFNYQLGQSPEYFMHSLSFKHYHPTQKPEPLIEWIMKYWSFEGDAVLDPFLGSGTTMVVAKKLNRNCIGIEIDKEYIEIAKKRLDWGFGLDVEYVYEEAE